MNITKRLVETITWAAASDLQVDLPNEGLITRIDIECAITGSGAMAAAAASHALWRVIQNLKIEGGGGKSYFGMTGIQMGILLHYLNLRDFPGKTWREIVATTQSIGWRLHFGSRPRDVYGRDNPFDLTAAIPAMDETNLKLTWSTTAATAMDDTITLSSATMRFTIHEVLGVRPEGLMVPVSSSESYDPGATKSDLSGQRDIPTGNYLRRIAVMALDATAYTSVGPLLQGDQATELGILLTKENRRLFEARTKQLELVDSPAWDGNEVTDTPNTKSPFTVPGLYCIDLRQYDHPDYGLDTRKFNTGDIKLGMTIGAYGAAEKEHIWYDQVQVYAGKGI